MLNKIIKSGFEKAQETEGDIITNNADIAQNKAILLINELKVIAPEISEKTDDIIAELSTSLSEMYYTLGFMEGCRYKEVSK